MAITKIEVPELFDFGSDNSAFKLPTGTTAERPTSPSNGEMRFNTTTGYVEYYDTTDAQWWEIDYAPILSSDNFNTVLYTGNGGTQQITTLDFQPDLVWTKQRNGTGFNLLIDSVRGGTKEIYSNSTASEGTSSNTITSFLNNGYSIGNNNSLNGANNTYVAWNFKAGGAAVSNTDGTITSQVSANTAAGFSIVSYTGNGSSSATVGHGLDSIPELTIFKQRSSGGTSGGYWNVYYTSSNIIGFLNETNALVTNSGGTNGSVDISNMDSTKFGFLAGSSSVNNQNNNLLEYIVYAFHSVAGYSKIGSYTGNGSATGPVVDTGFEPAWVMIKSSSSDDGGGGAWLIYDNKRSTSNPRNKRLYANYNYAELTSSSYDLDFLSNGFQPKSGTSSYGFNTLGVEYIYMAFAADPT